MPIGHHFPDPYIQTCQVLYPTLRIGVRVSGRPGRSHESSAEGADFSHRYLRKPGVPRAACMFSRLFAGCAAAFERRPSKIHSAQWPWRASNPLLYRAGVWQNAGVRPFGRLRVGSSGRHVFGLRRLKPVLRTPHVAVAKLQYLQG